MKHMIVILAFMVLEFVGFSSLTFAVDVETETTSPPTNPALITKVSELIETIKGKQKFDERLMALNQIKNLVETSESAGEVEGVQYFTALQPVLNSKQDLSDADKCEETRGEILYLFRSGTGYKGKLSPIATSVLGVLAAVCADQKLAEVPEEPIDK